MIKISSINHDLVIKSLTFIQIQDISSFSKSSKLYNTFFSEDNNISCRALWTQLILRDIIPVQTDVSSFFNFEEWIEHIKKGLFIESLTSIYKLFSKFKYPLMSMYRLIPIDTWTYFRGGVIQIELRTDQANDKCRLVCTVNEMTDLFKLSEYTLFFDETENRLRSASSDECFYMGILDSAIELCLTVYGFEDKERTTTITFAPIRSINYSQIPLYSNKSMTPKSNTNLNSLTGLFTGVYGPYGTEVVHVTYDSIDNNNSSTKFRLTGRKVIGDAYVPANKITFEVNYSNSGKVMAVNLTPPFSATSINNLLARISVRERLRRGGVIGGIGKGTISYYLNWNPSTQPLLYIFYANGMEPEEENIDRITNVSDDDSRNIIFSIVFHTLTVDFRRYVHSSCRTE